MQQRSPHLIALFFFFPSSCMSPDHEMLEDLDLSITKMGRTTSEHTNKSVIVEKPHNGEPHLSCVVVRNLVRQPSFSRSQEIINPHFQDGKIRLGSPKNLTNFSSEPVEPQQQYLSGPCPFPQSKKQVRRRNLRSRRPYQERVINMAEARREIVNALKLHRAAMRSSGQLQKMTSLQEVPSLSSRMSIEGLSHELMLGRDTGIHHSSNASFNCLNDTCFQASFCASNLSWNHNTTAARFVSKHFGPFQSKSAPLLHDLSFHDLMNIGNAITNNDNSSLQHHLSVSPKQWAEIPVASCDPRQIVDSPKETMANKLHRAMNKEEIAEIRLMCEQHDMEWNDMLNLSTSAWWRTMLENMETISEEKDHAEGVIDGLPRELIAWMNASQASNADSLEVRPDVSGGVGWLQDEVTSTPAWLNDQQVLNQTNSEA